MPIKDSDIIIVGGGAAGLTAAIVAAHRGARVSIFEKNIRVGKKILATGNGRCNMSNTLIGKPEGMSHYNHPAFVAPVLSRFDCAVVRSFFEDLGLMTVVDKKGWVFPRTRTANTVLDVLLREINSLPITTYTGQEVIGIHEAEDEYRVEAAGTSHTGRVLILSCGVAPVLSTLHLYPLVSPTPVLGPLKTDTESVRGLDGIRAVCRIYLTEGDEIISWQDGELLFRDYGVSGIAVFNLSRYARRGQSLSIDFFPDHDVPALETLLRRRREKSRRASTQEVLTGMLHSRVIQAVLRKSGVKASSEPDDAALRRLANIMKAFQLKVTEGPARDQAQVIRGGLSTEDFDPGTLMCLSKPRLFAAGECLDVDGSCGGFNLHWAWASGLVAGEGAASSF